MQEPLVSVIIPVYNGKNYLSQAIDSVLSQTYSNIEIIVVNDGSNDGGATEQVALSYGDRIKYIKKENGGVATALNCGIKHMTGEYFSWLSHDDVFYKDKITQQVSVLEEKLVNITACSYDIFWDSGRKVPVHIIDFYGKDAIEKGTLPVLQAIIQFGGILFRKDLFEKYGLFDENLKSTQDYEFLFRILRKEKCIYTNECLYGIRYHESQSSNTFSSIDKDRDEMYLAFMKQLSSDEKVAMYGSEYGFYYEMLLRVRPLPGMNSSIKMCLEELKNSSENLDVLSIEDGKSIYIYGAGVYGRRLLFNLRCRGINVEGFIDGNSSIWGTYIEGIPCFCVDDIITSSKNYHIVIAALFREEISQNLKDKGINNYCFREDYERKVLPGYPSWDKIKQVIG